MDEDTLIRNKIKSWLYNLDENNKTLYEFIDKITLDIYDELKLNGFQIDIPLFVFKQHITLFLFKNSTSAGVKYF